MTIAPYNYSVIKRITDIFLSSLFLFVSLPFFILFSAINLLITGGPVFFTQNRVGKDGKIFKIYKFRTMVEGAEMLLKKYRSLNESDGPAFKIKEDPRFTRFGRYLSRTGLDELPQFINVLKGEMSIVGPRPLPVKEAKKIPRRFRIREKIKPGCTSSWVVEGSHRLKFTKWMSLDRYYVLHGTFITDLTIIFKTMGIIFRFRN